MKYLKRLEDGPRRKIILLTDRTDDEPDVSEVDVCSFSNWPPDRLTVWEGIIIDWENATADFSFNVAKGKPTMPANRLIKHEKIFVDEQEASVPLGTPYIVTEVEKCPGEYQGLTATQFPRINIKTESEPQS